MHRFLQKRFYEIPVNQAKRGQIIKFNSKLVEVIASSHSQQGRSGSHYKLELKDLHSGSKTSQRFQSNAVCEGVLLDEKTVTFLYVNDDVVLGIDPISLEELEFPISLVQGGVKVLDFLNSESEIKIKLWNGKPIQAIPPLKGVFIVKLTDPVVSEKREKMLFKKAQLDNDVEVSVPEFIQTGDKIVVSISDQKYLSKYKD